MFLDPQVPVIVNFARPTGGLNRNLSLGSLVRSWDPGSLWCVAIVINSDESWYDLIVMNSDE